MMASREYHPTLPTSTTWNVTALSLMKNKTEIGSPTSPDMDYETALMFERDHQMGFEKDILSVIECKNSEAESIESRWYGLQDKVMMTVNGTWKHDPKMLPHLQQCAADLFARMYFREFNDNPKNLKYKTQGSKAILAQMKVELSGIKVWSCVFRGLEFRVYDKFGDPEEESTPDQIPMFDIQGARQAFKNWNLSWTLPGTTSHIEESPPLEIATTYSVLTSQSEVREHESQGILTETRVDKSPLLNINNRLPILKPRTRLPNTEVPSRSDKWFPEVGPPTLGRDNSLLHERSPEPQITVDPTPTDPPQTEVQRKTPIRLKIRIPQRQPSVVETSEHPRVDIPVYPPIQTESANLNMATPAVDLFATVPEYFMEFFHTQCLKCHDTWKTPSTEFYKAYETWRFRAKAPKMGKNSIGAALKKLGIVTKYIHGQTYYYIKLRSYK
jgi:hypothetical protein